MFFQIVRLLVIRTERRTPSSGEMPGRAMNVGLHDCAPATGVIVRRTRLYLKTFGPMTLRGSLFFAALLSCW